MICFAHTCLDMFCKHNSQLFHCYLKAHFFNLGLCVGYPFFQRFLVSHFCHKNIQIGNARTIIHGHWGFITCLYSGICIQRGKLSESGFTQSLTILNNVTFWQEYKYQVQWRRFSVTRSLKSHKRKAWHLKKTDRTFGFI